MTVRVDDLGQWNRLRRDTSWHGKKIGFVPTMGNLHDGHRSLLQRSHQENDITVASVFVNSTQFEDEQDLVNYPRTEASDLELAKAAKVDYALFPTYEELYPDDYRYRVTETELSRILCGRSREGHFEGVLTVVLRLLQIVRPHRCYLGEKDYQQLLLIQGLVSSFFIETEVVSCPTIRDSDGLAKSSRNRHLGPDERQLARKFPQILQMDLPVERVIDELERAGFSVEYVEEHFGRRFGAVRIGSTRLIDNFPLAEVAD